MARNRSLAVLAKQGYSSLFHLFTRLTVSRGRYRIQGGSEEVVNGRGGWGAGMGVRGQFPPTTGSGAEYLEDPQNQRQFYFVGELET